MAIALGLLTVGALAEATSYAQPRPTAFAGVNGDQEFDLLS